jgi:hypothetical protein
VTSRSGSQSPTVAWVPGASSSRSREAIELAASAGLRLDEWQQLVLDGSLGLRPDGKWAAFEVGLCVPRQNGKGAVLEARELAGIFLFDEKLVIHSSHEFATSMVAMNRMEDLLEANPDLSRQVRKVMRSHGQEGFTFVDGRRIWYRTRTKGGGRGFSADLVILDEAMILQEPFHGALLPIVSSRSLEGNPQVFYTGSAVDRMFHEHGVVFARMRERGRRGDEASFAWFEWCGEVLGSDGETVPLGEVDPGRLNDAELWAAANPGMGIRIAEEHIAKEASSMETRQFAVERIGIGDWPATVPVDGDVIRVADWLKLADEHSKMVGPVCLAFDVKPDRSFASIAAAGIRSDGVRHGELVDHRGGTGWVAKRIAGLLERHESLGVVCDPYGPAGSLLTELEELGIEVREVTAREHTNACGALFDLVGQSLQALDGEEFEPAQTLRHLGQPELSAAIKAATKRPLGDSWAWSRKGSVDISPLVAVTLALWGAATLDPPKKKPFIAVAFE